MLLVQNLKVSVDTISRPTDNTRSYAFENQNGEEEFNIFAAIIFDYRNITS